MVSKVLGLIAGKVTEEEKKAAFDIFTEVPTPVILRSSPRNFRNINRRRSFSPIGPW